MSFIFVRMPKYPECWQSCGSCASGDVFVLELLMKVGDVIARDDNVLTLETGKVADELKAMGYTLEDQGWNMGDIQAIRVQGTALETASDPRGRGVGMVVK